MKTEFLYAIVDPWGACRRIVGGKSDPVRSEPVSLPDLLAEGWRPVRETPFANVANSSSMILICLEREPEGQAGFGFGQ